MNYTPETPSAGPWTVQQLEAEHHGYSNWPTYAIRSLSNVCIAIVGDVDRYESERIPANSRLIAAAPELLEAAKEVVEMLEHVYQIEGPHIKKLKAAIDKATKGEEGQ